MSSLSKLKPFDKIGYARSATLNSSTQKLILVIIASHLGKSDFCYLSISTLQKECSIAKRASVTKNIDALVKAKILFKLPPSHGFKSNRYGINFELLVTDGNQTGYPRSLDWLPSVTRLVTDGNPKRNINNNLNKIKGEPLVFENKKQSKAQVEAMEKIWAKLSISKTKIKDRGMERISETLTTLIQKEKASVKELSAPGETETPE